MNARGHTPTLPALAARAMLALTAIFLLTTSVHAGATTGGPLLVSTLALSQGAPPEEEEEAPLPKAKSKLDTPEEEEEAPPKTKSKLDAPEEEEEAPPKKPGGKPPEEEEERPPGRPAGGGSLDKPAAGQTDDDDETPAEPVCDRVFINDREVRIRLYPDVLPFPLSTDLMRKEFAFQMHFSSEDARGIRRVKGREMTRQVRYYEEWMWIKAAEALGVPPKELIEAGRVLDLSNKRRAAGVARAEKLLVTAIAEHDSAVQQNLRQGSQWGETFRKPLIQALMNLKLSQVDQLLAEESFQQAESVCDRLLADFNSARLDPTLLRSRFERIYLDRAQQAADAAEYARARELLEQLSRRYPLDLGGKGRTFREGLIRQAKDHLLQAQELPLDQAPQALALIKQAEAIWPELPGLDTRRSQLKTDYPTLVCAYTELPVNLSPLLARSAVERHAVSLMFERLVHWIDDPRAGPHYSCQLARGRPVGLARGRQFFLRNCRWSDSEENNPHLLTVEDIRLSVSLLKNSSLFCYRPSWSQLVDGVSAVGNDPFVVSVNLNRDYWQPLALMDFVVLPSRAFPAGGQQTELARFNKQPFGTGPYQLADRQDDRLRFVANPYYHTPGQPSIREVNFQRLESTQAVSEFQQGNVQLIYGVRPEHVTQLRQQSRRVEKLRTPSVWFLAPNYMRDTAGRLVKTQLNNEKLRLAIAHAIRRDEILDQFFRPGRGSRDHVALTGPYPKGTWADNPRVQAFEPTRAKAFADLARGELGSIAPLRLAYTQYDLEAENACKQIQAQVATVGIAIELQPIPPEEFYGRIVDKRDFDLVYWRHDYEDETYWLWPLLNPAAQGPGGANFMRYNPDADMNGFFQRMTLHKRFPDIQKQTHAVHEHVAKTVPIIPLWQLDTYVAVGEAMQNNRLDPFDLYHDVAKWKLRAP